MTTEFVKDLDADPPFSLIEQKSLGSRLFRELQAATAELTRDPIGFIRELFSADTKDAKRRQRIYAGLTLAIVVHVAVVGLIAVMGWRTVFVKHADETVEDIHFIAVGRPKTNEGTPKGKPASTKDAGGGGDRNPLPPTRGPLPTTSAAPQIVKPNTPSVKLPTIPVTPTIIGPDGSPPPPGVALGVPTGVIAAAPSPGSGEGGGLGGNRGSGAGSGGGPGSAKGNPGSDRNQVGSPNSGDDTKVPISYSLFDKKPDRTPIVWLHRPTPVITPEAQANKVKGEVWLRATFGEDGKISDIEVIRDVPFMTESAIESLQRSRFRPATIKGRPVTLTNVPVRINVDVIRR